MTKRSIVAGAWFVLALGLGILWFVWKGQSSASQPLAVIFVGDTNGLVGGHLTACIISNQCSRTLKVWAIAYVEAAPFKDTNGPNQWTVVEKHRDSYLKPGEIEHLTFRRPAITGQWRLMIPWSEGYRAKITERILQYKFIPPRFTVAPEYYATSAVTTTGPAKGADVPFIYADATRRRDYTFSGYTTPQSALQSVLWAITQMDAKAFQASLTGEVAAGFTSQFKDLPEGVMPGGFKNGAMFKASGFRILEETLLSEKELRLKVFLEGTRLVIKPVFRKVGGEWKWAWNEL
jgi:hypothetical protein